MTTQTKSILALIGAVIIAGAIYGAYQYPEATQQLAGSSAGSSFSTAKVASQVVTVSTSTVFSLLNTDASSRVILGTDIFLTGGAATTTAYAVTCATSTAASGPGNGTASNILALTLAFNGTYYGTTTSPGAVYVASTSPGITGTTSTIAINAVLDQNYNQYARIWPSGSYLNCKLVTSGGSVSGLFDSGITGTISFPYRGQ